MTSIYSGGELLNYLIHFANTLEPGTGDEHLPWPRYSIDSPLLMTILDGEEPLTLTTDTFREAAIETVIEFGMTNTMR